MIVIAPLNMSSLLVVQPMHLVMLQLKRCADTKLGIHVLRTGSHVLLLCSHLDLVAAGVVLTV